MEKTTKKILLKKTRIIRKPIKIVLKTRDGKIIPIKAIKIIRKRSGGKDDSKNLS